MFHVEHNYYLEIIYNYSSKKNNNSNHNYNHTSTLLKILTKFINNKN